MPNRTVSNQQLNNNKYFFITGNLNYARITRKLAGEALIKDDERRKSRGFKPVGRPYTTATVDHAEVVKTNPDAPTVEDIYAEESLYMSKAHPENGYFYTANNKGRDLPWVARREGNNIVEFAPEGELDRGLKVTLVMRVFEVKGQFNKGISLDGVIVEEPVRYYNSNKTAAMLAEHGLTFVPDPEAEKLRTNPQLTTEVDEENADAEESAVVNPYADNNNADKAAAFSSQNVPQNVPQNIPNPMAQQANMPPSFSPQGQGIRYTPTGSNNVNIGNRNY